MGPQQGEHPVLGLNFPRQYPVQLREADKAGILMGLVLQVPHRLAHPVHRGVGKIPAHLTPLFIAQAEKAPQPQLLLRQAGEKAANGQPPPLRAEFGKGLVHPLGVSLVGLHRAVGVEGAAQLLRPQKLGRLLPVDIAVKHAGEETGKGTVVLIADLGPGHGTPPPFLLQAQRPGGG